MNDAGNCRWPLHPLPHNWESIDSYVRRLAECYRAGLVTFGRHALGLSSGQVRNMDTAPESAYIRLSLGTGLSLEQLYNMRSRERRFEFARAIQAFAASPDGQMLIEAIERRRKSE